MKKNLQADTVVVAAGRPVTSGSPLNAPIVPASNFLLGEGLVYSREDTTDTWSAFETIVGELEDGRAVTFSSGMAAAAAVFEQVPGGGQVVLPEDCYQGVAGLAAEGEHKGRWNVSRLPTEDTDAWTAAARTADLLWTESPSNPMLFLADLPALGSAPRKPGSLWVVDNTFATPLNQRPLSLGADISMHSATKYFGGHSDLLGGVLVARDGQLEQALRHTRKLTGGTPGALEAFLATRGLRTLAVRLERAQENALELARFLEAHPAVRNVRYPGLPSHPQHRMASMQLGGFGAIIAFELDADGASAHQVCDSSTLVQHATSLGSVESTWERRAAHGGQDHIPETLIRISVGIENINDLKADLAQALSVLERSQSQTSTG